MRERFVEVVTPAAVEWIEGGGPARVLHVFEKACNLVDDRGRVLALVAEGVGLSPFGARLGPFSGRPFEGVTADSAVTVRDGQLFVGELRFEFGRARCWQPGPDWLALRDKLAESPLRLEAMLETIGHDVPDGSLLEIYKRLPIGSGEASPLLRRVSQNAPLIAAGLRSGDLEAGCNAAKAIAGLGGGLTPAGDDFLAGMFLAAWAGLFGLEAEQRCLTLAEVAAPLTTRLSAAYLHSAARGECMERWHGLFGAMLNDDVVKLRLEIGELLRVGHTSGADALAGFLAHTLAT